MKNEPSLRVKKWDDFQHYKSGKNASNPEWIKLYRKLLDDFEWHKLSGNDGKCLVMLWLIAAEDDGYLPSMQEVAFRLRLEINELEETLGRLTHWFEDCPRKTLYQNKNKKKNKKKNKNIGTEIDPSLGEEEFEAWWKVYPRKIGKPKAQQSYEKLRREGMSANELLAGLQRWLPYYAGKELEYVPHATTFLNQRRFDDAPPAGRVADQPVRLPERML